MTKVSELSCHNNEISNEKNFVSREEFESLKTELEELKKRLCFWDTIEAEAIITTIRAGRLVTDTRLDFLEADGRKRGLKIKPSPPSKNVDYIAKGKIP
ncbi:peptidase S8/S53 subtilisin kexin sedolisin [Acetobacter orientalis]|uniref:Peptidase S8/S53 subtilisin kexin sedolisin n=1 Tax=Acetobacter orientalis TaxID=146474 RepID=A0A2Z5ZLJ6_9PROT|nr:peptidase S8/S53 subtilisin kexin sedolisin [Acetobacter orientalis]